MSRNVAIFLIVAGFIILAFNLVDLVESGNNRGVWFRIASNICIIIVGLLTFKNKKNENRRIKYCRNQ